LITLNDIRSIGLLWTRDRPVAEASTCTLRNIHEKQTYIHPVRFETAIPESKRPQSYAHLLLWYLIKSTVYIKPMV